MHGSMDDNHTLLIKVLKHHFKSCPQIVDDALEVIKNYRNNRPNKNEYEKTLNTLYEMMNNDLPSNILLHFLTMVPLPPENDSSNVMKLMKQTHNSLPDNMRPILMDYLKNQEATSTPQKLASTKSRPKLNLEPTAIIDITVESCKTLLDICAEYVVKNNLTLKQYYDTKNKEIWELVNSNGCDNKKLLECYEVIKDINKKIKWLRMFDLDNVPQDIINDEYGNSEVFLKVSHVNFTVEDPFIVSSELDNAVRKLCN